MLVTYGVVVVLVVYDCFVISVIGLFIVTIISIVDNNMSITIIVIVIVIIIIIVINHYHYHYGGGVLTGDAEPECTRPEAGGAGPSLP